MPRADWSPRIVPYGADQTAYLVVDRFTSGSVYRETEIERTDLETIINDFMTGQFNDPLRVIAFNTLEHWSDDVSAESKLAATCKPSGCLSICRLCEQPRGANPAVEPWASVTFRQETLLCPTI
jgi:hypothetical protein